MATILGIDIDPQHVRVAVIKTALRRSELTGYHSAPLPQGMDDEERVEVTRRVIEGLLSQIDGHVDRVITELSGHQVSVRQLSLPAKALKRIDELLPFELEELVPFDPEESVIDHQLIGTEDAELRLLAAVVPKERVREHLELMSSLGVEPRQVAVGAVALDGLVALIPSLAVGGPHCVIDVNLEGTDVCILKEGSCHFARTLSFSLKDLDAGQGERLGRELRQTLAAWAMIGHGPPETFLLGGVLGTREGACQWLSTIADASVEPLALPNAPEADTAQRPAFTRAAALAGRALSRREHIDMRQGEFAAKQTMTALRQHLPLLSACAAMILGAFIFSNYAQYSVLQARHAQLEDELGRVTQAQLGVEARSPDQALRLLERGARGNDPMPTFDAYDVLTAISASIPESVVHDVRRLQVDLGDGDETGRFSLRGTVSSIQASEEIHRALSEYRTTLGNEEEDAPSLQCFHELDQGPTSQTAGGRHSYRIEGSIRCRPEGASDDDEDEGGRRRRSRRRR